MTAALLGVDVGTTSTKAVLFDLAGRELARSESDPYRLLSPQPGWVEQDPEELWQAVLFAIREVVRGAESPVNIQAVGMAVQSGSLLPASEAGRPVYPLITWMDGRTEALVQGWREQGLGAQVKPISGWSLYPGLCLPTIAWLRKNDPATYSRAERYFSVNDFIAHRLTGEFCTNPSNGGGMQLVDIHSGEWSPVLCEIAGIQTDQLSALQPSAAVIGEISAEICREAGLPTGTVLVNGGHDQGCTAVGLGVNAPGKVLLACGTAWVVTGVVGAGELAGVPEALDINFHPAPDRWTISQSLGGLGASLEWWINQAWAGERAGASRIQAYEALNQGLADTSPGGGGLFFLPLTGGHEGPATSRPGGFSGLQLSHTREDMARAVLESAAYELQWALSGTIEAGLPMERLWMVGGAARSPYWPNILANVTGVPINLPQYDNWPALGGAVLAGVGCGVYDSIDQGVEHFRKPVETLNPDPEEIFVYDELFKQYQQLQTL
jgi:xylulokinase